MGGGKSGVGKLLPILLLFLREIFWRFGCAQEFFIKHVYLRPDGQIYCDMDIDQCYVRPTKLSNGQVEMIARTIVDLSDDFDKVDEHGVSMEMESIIEGLDPDNYAAMMDTILEVTNKDN